MIQRSSGSADLEFLRKLITDHPITDEQAVLLDLLDEKTLCEAVGPQHTKSFPRPKARKPEAPDTKTQEPTHDIATGRPPTKK